MLNDILKHPWKYNNTNHNNNFQHTSKIELHMVNVYVRTSAPHLMPSTLCHSINIHHSYTNTIHRHILYYRVYISYSAMICVCLRYGEPPSIHWSFLIIHWNPSILWPPDLWPWNTYWSPLANVTVTLSIGEKNTLIETPPPPSFGTPRRRALSARIQELNRSLLEESSGGQNRTSYSDAEDSG